MMIKHLPPAEQEQVVEFVQTLETRRPWSGEKLTDYEKKMWIQMIPRRRSG